MIAPIGVVGIGRMGRGIALSYVYAGIPVVLVDIKKRTDEQREALFSSARQELTKDLQFLVSASLLEEQELDKTLSLVSFGSSEDGTNYLEACDIIFEGVPEVMAVKKEAFEFIFKSATEHAIVASTTSTILVTELADLVTHPNRFVNAHWLNPAHLMPLVEVSKSDQTSQDALDILVASLESIGKMPVVCSASPGYIVPRIQALAMNEAARLVEEGVASAEDVDKAINIGFGLRFAVLGMLEFIDWGGGDILSYASQHLSRTIDSRFAAPEIVESNMNNNKNGVRDGEGFFNYQQINVDEYRQKRMKEFVSLLKYRQLLPAHNQALLKEDTKRKND